MKLDNSNIIYQTGGIKGFKINFSHLFICGSSQRAKIECKKQENEIKSDLETSLDDINIDDKSMNDEELEKELEKLMKEKKPLLEEELEEPMKEKPLSKKEVAREMKELKHQVENNMSEVSNNPLARQWFKISDDEEKKLEDELNELSLGGGKIGTALINSYVEIEKLKIIETNKKQQIKQLIKEALALKEQWENAKLRDKSKMKTKLKRKVLLKKKATKILEGYSKNIVTRETSNKNTIRAFINANTTGLNKKQFDLRFHKLLSSIITKAQKKFQEENTSLGGKTKKQKKQKKQKK